MTTETTETTAPIINQALLDYEAELAQAIKDIKRSVGAPASNVISTKGKLFSLPDGTTNTGPMDAIIVDFTSYNSYFKGVYNPNEIVPPCCYAVGRFIDELKPSVNAPEPQSTDCASCPRNQFGSAPTGRGKACKNTRRLALLPPNADANTPLMTISVSPSGLKGFDAYVTSLEHDFGKAPLSFITRISFNAKEAYPTLVFDQPRLHDKLAVVMTARKLANEIINREPDAKPKA